VSNLVQGISNINYNLKQSSKKNTGSKEKLSIKEIKITFIRGSIVKSRTPQLLVQVESMSERRGGKLIHLILTFFFLTPLTISVEVLKSPIIIIINIIIIWYVLFMLYEPI
jgi:hypothetical protein